MGKVQLDAILKLVDVQVNPQVFRKISQSVAGMPAALGQTAAQLKQVGQHAGVANKRLQKTGQVLSTNERAARLFLQRMAQFAILLPTFATLNRAIQGSVKFLFEFDSALRDIVRIDISGLKDRMEEVGDAALATAVKYGVTGTEVLGVTRIFKQAGFTIEESQAKAEAAILATQISTLTSAQAVEVFIAAQKQFVGEGENSIAVLDKLAKVEDVAAVNASDVAEAFRAGGNALAEFAQNIDDSIGIIAALREQSRKSGREIGTFLKTIQTRLFAAGEARDAVEALGVEVENLDGSLRPTLAVLNDMKMRFDDLTDAQKANAAKAIAGIRQFESLLATLNSLERANELSREASEAAGTAEEKRVITDAKLERQLGRLIAQGQQLAEAMGDAGLEETMVNVLKSAEKILAVFTKFAGIVDGIGGNLTPLLALAGVTLGRSVFGIAKGGGAGAAGAMPKPGDAGFIGPIQKQTNALAGTFKSLGGVISNTIKHERALAFETRFTTASFKELGGISKGLRFEYAQNTKAVQAHKAALQQSIANLKMSARGLLPQGRGSLKDFGGAGGTLLLSLVGTTLPAAFSKLSAGLRTFDNSLAELTASTLDASSTSLSMAAQFAVLGGKASAVAAAFGAVQTALPIIIAALEDEFDARGELRKQIEAQAKEENVLRKLGSQQSGLSGDVVGTLVDTIERTGVQGGKQFSEAMSKAFEEIGQEAGVTGQEFAKTFLSPVLNELSGVEGENFLTKIGLGPDTLERLKGEISDTSNLKGIDVLILKQQDLLKARAEEIGTLDQLEELTQGVKDGNLNAAQTMTGLLEVLGKGEVQFNEFTKTVIEASKSLAELEKIRQLQGAIDSFRTLGQELELARLGPEALADSVVRMQQEIMLAEREFTNTTQRLEQGVGDLVGHLSDLGIFGDEVRLFQTIQEGLDAMDPDAIAEFNKFIEEQPPAVRKTIEKLLKLRNQQRDAELDFQKQQNALQAEMIARRKALFEAEAQAAQNAFESTRKFSAELKQFGESVTSDILSQFQNIDLMDVESVLAGTSDLNEGLQQLILSAFADPITQAEQELAGVTAMTEAQLDILANRLDIVNQKLSDEANASNKAALTAEKRSIELEIENTKQEGAISATDAKIKILEAEQEAAKEAAEAEAKRLELLEKLADASRAFEQQLRDVNRDFEEFKQQKIADLIGEEADARQELKDAQQEVLDATIDLADAYQDLVIAQLEFNGAITEAQIKSNLLGRDIAELTGSVTTFSGRLNILGNAFRDALDDANITLQKRIELESQLAQETLSFLQQAKDEIVQAGIGIFGQTGAENRALGQGIAGLQFVADQLGGSFEAFLSLTQGELSAASETLLSLPAEFRQQILDALSFLPSTMNIGGFSVDQLMQAIGQVGAGVAPEAGLPSIEELNTQQVEQLTRLQELALQDAQLQFSQVISAQEQVALAEEQLEAAQILQERAEENLLAVRDAVMEEKAVLDMANEQRNELLNAVIAADDKNTLLMIEREAQAFSEQNAVFREIGDNIVTGVSAAIGAKLAVIEAAAAVAGAAKGHIPNFATGNLNPKEAAGLLRAAAREKRVMPPGAGLAVANTSETIIPMRNSGHVPNFQAGANVDTGDSNLADLLVEVIRQLSDLNDKSDDISDSTSQIETNTSTTGGTQTTAAGGQDVRITLQTNQNSTISVTGLEALREELATAVRDAASEQVEEQLVAILEQIDNVIVTLQERGLLSSFGQLR